jgi:hypothetical protein
MIVYISIGNSDDRLTQKEWAQYVLEITTFVAGLGHTHGAWYSEPASAYQNACYCVEFKTQSDAYDAKIRAMDIRAKFRQDSVAWAVAKETEFI